jgi:hypothetical protein
MKFYMTFHDMTKYKGAKIAKLYINKNPGYPSFSSSYKPMEIHNVVKWIFRKSVQDYEWKLER